MRDFGLGFRQLGFRILGQRALGFARSRAFGVQHFQALGFGALGISPGFSVAGYGFSLSQGLCSGHQGVESMFRVGFGFCVSSFTWNEASWLRLWILQLVIFELQYRASAFFGHQTAGLL